MSNANFLDGKKTYIGAFISALVMVAPDVQELLTMEAEWTTFNFWIPAGKIAIAAFTAFGRYVAGNRIEIEVNDANEAEKDALKAKIEAKANL